MLSDHHCDNYKVLHRHMVKSFKVHMRLSSWLWLPFISLLIISHKIHICIALDLNVYFVSDSFHEWARQAYFKNVKMEGRAVFQTLPWSSFFKHRKNCKSCQSQVTWNVKFKCQFCFVLSRPVLSDHEEVGGYMRRLEFVMYTRKLEVVWSLKTSDLLA